MTLQSEGHLFPKASMKLVIVSYLTIFLILSVLYSQDPPYLFQYNQSILQAFYFFETAEVSGSEITEDDWIGAFRGDVCVGSTIWLGAYTDVPVMGDDGTEWTIGYMQVGEYPEFKIYDASLDQYFEAEPWDEIPWQVSGQPIIPLLNLDDRYLVPAILTINVFPNPFNSNTQIIINLHDQNRLDVAVYNLRGQLQSVLYNGLANPGSLHLNWSCTHLPSGIYFLRATAGYGSDNGEKVAETQKLYMIK